MAFRQSRQGLRYNLRYVHGFLLIFCLTFLGGGCAAKKAAVSLPASSNVLQDVASESAPSPKTAPRSVPERESDFASVLSQGTDVSSAPAQDAGFSTVVFQITDVFDHSYQETDFAFSSQQDADSESHMFESRHSSQPYADIEPVPSISDIVLAQYDDWRGVRYRAGGSDSRGVDCSGLVQAIYRDAFEMELPRTSVEQSRMGDPVKRGEIQPGDLVYFLDRGRKHVGVAINEQQFVHASRRKGVIVSKFDGYWTSRLLRIRRILDDKEQDVLIRKGG